MAEKTYNKEQLDEQVAKAVDKEQGKTAKVVAAAVKAETTRVLGILKDTATANKEVESKEVKTHVANLLKELTAAVKEAA